MKIATLSKVLIGAAITLLSLTTQAAVYVVAHPDDLQLMLAGNAIVDIQGNYPTVIVILSAGDAKNLNMSDNPNRPSDYYEHNTVGYKYYRVRMDAHEASIKTWLPLNYSRAVVHSAEYFSSAIPAVERAVVGNVTTYYLNIPDTQLAALYDFGGTLMDVEGVNSYTRNSLKDVIRKIIQRNSKGISALAVNYQEPDPGHSEPGYNEAMLKDGEMVIPNSYSIDHGDHTAAGKFVRDAIQENSAFWCVGQIIYMGYASSMYPDSLTPNIKQRQQDGYLALHNTLVNEGNVTFDYAVQQLKPGAWDAFHISYFGKQRFRLYGISGAGPCSF